MRIKRDDIQFERCKNCSGLEFGFVSEKSTYCKASSELFPADKAFSETKEYTKVKVCCKSCGHMLRIANNNDLNLMLMQVSDNQDREAYMRGFQDGYKVAMSEKEYFVNDIKVTEEARKYINDFNQQLPLNGKGE